MDRATLPRLLAGPLLAAGCDDPQRKGTGMPADPIAIADVEIFQGERLPPWARGRQATSERGIDQAMFLAFDAPPEEVPVFADRLQLPLTRGEDASMALRNPGVDWWTRAPGEGSAPFRGGMVSRRADNRHIPMLAVARPDGHEQVWLAAHSN